MNSRSPLGPEERHELECLRARVLQIEYPCSPHCDGYLRELSMRALLADCEKKIRAYHKEYGAAYVGGPLLQHLYPRIKAALTKPSAAALPNLPKQR